MLKKTINVGGKEVAFRSSATVPRLYRAKFKRDIFKDLAKLQNSYKGTQEDGDEFAIDDLEIFENVAYIMAYHADNTIRKALTSGLISLRCFPFMRYCRRFLHFGVQTLSRILILKKT